MSDLTSAADSVLDLAGEEFLLLTTTRRTGVDVPTAVWVGRDGDALIVTTGVDSGKVKRIRHTPRVTLQACDRAGRPAEGAPRLVGHAIIDDSPEARRRLDGIFTDKYGMPYTLIAGASRLRRGTGSTIVRITDGPAPAQPDDHGRD